MTTARLHDGFLVHKGFRYAWLAVVLVALVAAAVVYRDQFPPATADLVFGYGVGGLALVIMLVLAWFGVRKRSYARGAGRLKGWLSAHVYLGIALIFLVPLHGGFAIGPDVHGAAYVLVLVTVITGLFGVVFYALYPRRIAANREGLTFDDMVKRIAEVDIELRGVAPVLSEAANNIVRSEAARLRIGGGVGILFFRPRNSSRRAQMELQRLALDGEAARRAELLLDRKAVMVDRMQRDVQQRSRLRTWLLIHVPLSLAALAVVVAHAVGMLVFGLGVV